MRNNLYDDDVLDDLLFVLFIRLGQIPNCKFCSIIIPSFLLLVVVVVSVFFCSAHSLFRPSWFILHIWSSKCVSVNRNMVGTVDKKPSHYWVRAARECMQINRHEFNDDVERVFLLRSIHSLEKCVCWFIRLWNLLCIHNNNVNNNNSAQLFTVALKWN